MRAAALTPFAVLGAAVALWLVLPAHHRAQPLVPTSADQIRSRTLPSRLGPPKCAYRDAGALPDPVCTPGAVNRAVTQKTIGGTICKKGWAASMRPPLAVTEPQKFASMRAYGIPTSAGHAGLYEYDHLIPLELGGAVDDARNLWPEAHAVPGAGSFAKDGVENRLNALVCSGKLSLARARRVMRTDWRTKP